MFKQLIQRGSAAWLRLVDRLPLSDHGIEAEVPRGTFVVATVQPVSITSPVSPSASGQLGSQ